MSAWLWAALALGARAVPSDDFSAVRAHWAAAREAARTDPAAALPLYDALIAEAPANNGILRSAIGAAAAAQDRARLTRWLDRFARAGGALLQGRDLVPAGPVREAIDRNGAAFGTGTVAARIPAMFHLIEGVARDPRGGAIFVSSVVDRAIVRIDPRGHRRLVATLTGDQGSPLALVADGARGMLWAAVDADPFGGRGGTGGLLRVPLRDGEPRLIPGPEGTPLHLGDVTTAPDGTAYGADSQSGALYRCPPGCERLELLVPPARLRSAQGMAVAPDGRSLWVSDYAYGLLRVELDTGRIRQVRASPGIALDGIDGMALRRGRLVAVQNAAIPARVVELRFDPAHHTVTALRVLARGGAIAEAPTQLTVARHGSILLVANSQWSRYDRAPAGASTQAETRIVRIPY